ncbi:DUF4258 domain-containing protein [Sulfobacillus thermosulfidooxidans]|uniref:DUF4258 domain-containing protein n=1 Tax=Sulfobacillus thermosulfidooxidans TaxID=28034 RepID=UPI0009EB14DD|nr:DUF4258 domain-containing protein [Sulfobacillus thermosulfidooxidans]
MDNLVEYTYHARQRMIQRNITESEVLECLFWPDITYPDGHGHMNYIKNSIRVVATLDRKKVITVVRQS